MISMAQPALFEDDSEEKKLTRAQHQALVHEGVTLYQLQRSFWADFGPANIPVSRDNDLVAHHFPNISLQLLAPAFVWPRSVSPGFAEGHAYPTDEDTIFDFVKAVTDRRSWARYHECDFRSEDGRPFRYVILSTSSRYTGSIPEKSSKLRVWLQGGVHGNEPAGDQALLALLSKMDLEDHWTASLLQYMDILIFPCYNPDGIAMFNRPSAFGIDPNRDHIKFTIAQTKHIKRLFYAFVPHVAADLHEYSARARFRGYTHGSDIMFSAAKNLNIHPRIRNLSEMLFTVNIGKRLEQAQFRWEPYAPTTGTSITFKEAGSDGKIGRNAVGLTQCISFLSETRGLGIADQHFHRRTAAALTFAQSLLEISADNHELIRDTVETLAHEFMYGKDEVVIKDRPTIIHRTFTMIDIKTGKLTQLPIEFASTTPTVATLTRCRPEAYLIPASMPDIAQRLMDLGLEVQKVQCTSTRNAEVLTIATAILGRTYFEGIVPLTVTTKSLRRSVDVPVGSYLVTTRQRNAALAFIALEPENIDSYVSLNIIPLISGDEYPIYRILTPL